MTHVQNLIQCIQYIEKDTPGSQLSETITLTPELFPIPVISPLTHVQSLIPCIQYIEKDTPESQSSQSITLAQLPYLCQVICPLTHVHHQMRCNHEQNSHECQSSETITSISVPSSSQVIYPLPHVTQKQLRPLTQVIQATPIVPRSKSSNMLGRTKILTDTPGKNLIEQEYNKKEEKD